MLEMITAGQKIRTSHGRSDVYCIPLISNSASRTTAGGTPRESIRVEVPTETVSSHQMSLAAKQNSRENCALFLSPPTGTMFRSDRSQPGFASAITFLTGSS